jgi:hypothetical protein
MADREHALTSSHPSDNWAGRFATEADAEGILQLLVRTFGRWPLYDIDVPALDHLRWKLFTRDDVRGGQIVVDDGETIVGLNAFFRQWFRVKGRLRHTHQVVDLAVQPEHENRGVISATRRFAVSDRIPYCDVLFGPRGRIESREKIRRTGKWDPAMRPNSFLPVLVIEGPVAPQPPVRKRSWQMRTVDRFDERVRALWDEASQPFDLISAHNVDFLNWRYCDLRAGGWTVQMAEEGSKLLGYITYRSAGGWGYVGGLLALPERLDVVEGLLREMMRSLHERGIPAVQCWVTPSHPYLRVLGDIGMDKKRRHLQFIIHAENDDFSELEDPAALAHIVAGDTDLV